jgi:hypothetical protein
MRRVAYVDESEPDPRSGSAGVYILAAALVEMNQQHAISAEIAKLLLPGQPKLHWHVEDDRRRKLLTATVAGLPATYLVAVKVDRHATAERRRRLCLGRLLPELEAAGVSDVYVESRQAKQNARDLQLLDVLRARRQVGPGLRMYHRPGRNDPLLWMPDVIAGAVGARYRGDRSYEDLLVGRLILHEA